MHAAHLPVGQILKHNSEFTLKPIKVLKSHRVHFFFTRTAALRSNVLKCHFKIIITLEYLQCLISSVRNVVTPDQ